MLCNKKPFSPVRKRLIELLAGFKLTERIVHGFVRLVSRRQTAHCH
jgi:hypothetical protein